MITLTHAKTGIKMRFRPEAILAITPASIFKQLGIEHPPEMGAELVMGPNFNYYVTETPAQVVALIDGVALASVTD